MDWESAMLALSYFVIESIFVQDGLIIVVISIDKASNSVIAGPEIISRGFVYVREAEELIDAAKQVLNTTISNLSEHDFREWNYVKSRLRDSLSEYIYHKTKRSPMILPIIMES